MSHFVTIRNGMSNAGEKNLSNLAIAFLNPAGGVIGTNDYLIAAQSDGRFSPTGSDNTNVKVNLGRAYVPLSDGTMQYSTLLDTVVTNVAIASNSSGSGQIDSIVLYIDLSAAVDANADNVAKFFDVRGTGGLAPTNAQILTAIGASNPYIVLANIAVANGFTSINSGNITDLRPFASFSGTGTNGWVNIGATLTYSSTDGHTFVVSTSSDITASVGVSDRIKVTNQAATQYFIVTAINSSTITLYGGTTYSLTNTAITNPSYSHMKVPVGFNPNPVIWTEVFRDTTDSFQTSPVSTTWYNPGSFSLTIPIGNWRVFYSVIVQSNCTTANAVYASLSTANNSESDSDFTSVNQADSVGSLTSTPYVEKTLALAVKTQYFLICRESGVSTLLGFVGASYRATIIKAICSYL